MRTVFKIFVLLFLFSSSFAVAQDEDTVAINTHSPKRATILSAVLPGAGQVYNKQAWAVPIIYVGFGVMGYLAHDYNAHFKEFKTAWLAKTDNDTNTIDPYPYNDAEAIRNVFDQYRRWRDLNLIGIGVLYTLNIIHANVYGHLYRFTVDDVTFNFSPQFYPAHQRRGTSTGLSFSVQYKF